MRALLFCLPIGFAFASAAEAQKGRAVAVRAGTVHTVGSEGTLSNGTILIRGAKIVAVGEGIEIPGDATIVDYGPDGQPNSADGLGEGDGIHPFDTNENDGIRDKGNVIYG